MHINFTIMTNGRIVGNFTIMTNGRIVGNFRIMTNGWIVGNFTIMTNGWINGNFTIMTNGRIVCGLLELTIMAKWVDYWKLLDALWLGFTSINDYLHLLMTTSIH